MKIKGAIFDMDGTLIDSLMYWEDLYRRIGKKYFNDESFHPSQEVDKTIRHMIFAEAISNLKDHYNIPGTTDELLEFCEKGIPEFYRNIAKLKDGAITLLEDLKSKNIKLCLASATDINHVKIALEHHGIAKYFDCVLSCAQIGVGKHEPDIFLLALSELGVSANEVCVFEDSVVGLGTAKRIGCYTVGIFDKYNSNHESLKAISDIYLKEGESLATLCEKITKE